ncbi:MAG: MarR family winged helix-turn-helix transcriptional regulator [Solirubrobacteraceae bacterium]
MRHTETTPTPQIDTDQTARLRVVIARLNRRLRPTGAGSELTPTQTSVLFTIVRLGPLGLGEVAEVESVNPTMLSRITAQLCDAGLISRQASPGDRRAALVKATPAGRKMRERIHKERTAALGALVDGLDERRREALWAALPVLEELAERLPGPRGSHGQSGPHRQGEERGAHERHGTQSRPGTQR